MKKTISKKRKKGYTIPGYSNCGPLNDLDESASSGINKACLEHDREYGNIGSEAYYKNNYADRQFIKDLRGHKSTGVYDTAVKYSVLGAFKAKEYLAPNMAPSKRTHNSDVLSEAKRPNTDYNGIGGDSSTDYTDAEGGTDIDMNDLRGTQEGGGGEGGSIGGGLQTMGGTVIPGHQEDSLSRSITFKSSNTFRVSLDNALNTVKPFLHTWPNGGSPDDTNTIGKQQPAVSILSAELQQTRITLPWKMIPTNQLLNYTTPGQLHRYCAAGMVGYKVKSLNIKCYGLYNMQHYPTSSANLVLQGQDTGYLSVMQPEGAFIQNMREANQISSNETDQSMFNPNPKLVFEVGDTDELEGILGEPSPFTAKNHLLPCKVNIPGGEYDGAGNVAPYGPSTIDGWYSDLTRHSSQVLLSNREQFGWSWNNSDKRYLCPYTPAQTHAEASSQTPSSLERGLGMLPPNEWPICLDGNESYTKFEFGTSYQSITDNSGPGARHGMGMKQENRKKVNKVPPLLVKIPQLYQVDKDENPLLNRMVHSAWMYLDYSVEMEFKMGEPTKIYQGFNSISRFGLYNPVTAEINGLRGSYNSTRLAELKGDYRYHNFVGSNLRYNREMQTGNRGQNAIPSQMTYHNGLVGNYHSVFDNTIDVPLAVAAPETEIKSKKKKDTASASTK